KAPTPGRQLQTGFLDCPIALRCRRHSRLRRLPALKEGEGRDRPQITKA
ncbi:MAG: hypothetical protein BJ554DRAFT_6742, partial [Olpidium bornovanus]